MPGRRVRHFGPLLPEVGISDDTEEPWKLYSEIEPMTSAGMLIRHAKARGEWAELRFMTRDG